MNGTMLNFVMNNLPEEWEEITSYTNSYVLCNVSEYTQEFKNIESYFRSSRSRIIKIQRVQNPFQYGRYMLRKEMIPTYNEQTVFHAVHRDDMDVALKFNCDYRRYSRKNEGIYENNKHPMFYNRFSDMLDRIGIIHSKSVIKVLVLKILSNAPKSQCDYYVEYVVTI